FPAQSVGSSNTDVLDSPYLLVLITEISQSRQHGLIHLESRKSPTAEPFEAFSTWMAFGGNTRDLGSFGKETDKITDLHQIHEEVLFTERGDGVAGIKRRHRDLSSDGVRDLAMASGLQRDAVTTISLYIQNRF
ncbi:hypothetical protein Tco_0208361, partial [Tanacetum coccineum]